MQEVHYNKLKKIIAIYLPPDVNVDEISADSHLINELNINSANLVDIVLDVEDAFDITIEDAELEQLDTVQGALEIIAKKSK